MKVNDGLREWLAFIVIVISPHRKDMGAVIGFGCFKNDLIGNISKGKDEIGLP